MELKGQFWQGSFGASKSTGTRETARVWGSGSGDVQFEIRFMVVCPTNLTTRRVPSTLSAVVNFLLNRLYVVASVRLRGFSFDRRHSVTCAIMYENKRS